MDLSYSVLFHVKHLCRLSNRRWNLNIRLITKPSCSTKSMSEVRRYDAFVRLTAFFFFFFVLDIYGIWFISKNDCPRVTERLKRFVSRCCSSDERTSLFSLTSNVKENEQLKQIPPQTSSNHGNGSSTAAEDSSDIFSLLLNAQEKFQGTVGLPFHGRLISLLCRDLVETKARDEHGRSIGVDASRTDASFLRARHAIGQQRRT